MMKNEEKEDDDAEKKNKQSNFIDHIFICTGIVYRLTTRSPKMMSKTIKKLRKKQHFYRIQHIFNQNNDNQKSNETKPIFELNSVIRRTNLYRYI